MSGKQDREARKPRQRQAKQRDQRDPGAGEPAGSEKGQRRHGFRDDADK